MQMRPPLCSAGAYISIDYIAIIQKINHVFLSNFCANCPQGRHFPCPFVSCARRGAAAPRAASVPVLSSVQAAFLRRPAFFSRGRLPLRRGSRDIHPGSHRISVRFCPSKADRVRHVETSHGSLVARVHLPDGLGNDAARRLRQVDTSDMVDDRLVAFLWYV